MVPFWYTVMVAVGLRSSAGLERVGSLFAYTVTAWPALSVSVKLTLWGVMPMAEMVTNTVAVAVEVTACEPAVMVVVPTVSASRVALPVPVMVATAGSLLDHDTPVVKYDDDPSLKTPKACKVPEVPTWTAGAVGLIVIDVNVGLTKNPRQLTPKASATKTVKASVNASLRPTNIDNRLGKFDSSRTLVLRPLAVSTRKGTYLGAGRRVAERSR